MFKFLLMPEIAMWFIKSSRIFTTGHNLFLNIFKFFYCFFNIAAFENRGADEEIIGAGG